MHCINLEKYLHSLSECKYSQAGSAAMARASEGSSAGTKHGPATETASFKSCPAGRSLKSVSDLARPPSPRRAGWQCTPGLRNEMSQVSSRSSKERVSSNNCG